jgi:hypothetical protein
VAQRIVLEVAGKEDGLGAQVRLGSDEVVCQRALCLQRVEEAGDRVQGAFVFAFERAAASGEGARQVAAPLRQGKDERFEHFAQRPRPGQHYAHVGPRAQDERQRRDDGRDALVADEPPHERDDLRLGPVYAVERGFEVRVGAALVVAVGRVEGFLQALDGRLGVGFVVDFAQVLAHPPGLPGRLAALGALDGRLDALHARGALGALDQGELPRVHARARRVHLVGQPVGAAHQIGEDLAQAVLNFIGEHEDALRGGQRPGGDFLKALVAPHDVLDGAAVRHHGEGHARGLVHAPPHLRHQHRVVDVKRLQAFVLDHAAQRLRVARKVRLDFLVGEVGHVGQVVGRSTRRAHEDGQALQLGAVQDAGAVVVGRARKERFGRVLRVAVHARLADEGQPLRIGFLAKQVHALSFVGERLGHRARPEVRAGTGKAVAVNESDHVGRGVLWWCRLGCDFFYSRRPQLQHQRSEKHYNTKTP